MMDIEQIVREYIAKSLHMSLATVAHDQPWVSELHFVYDDDLQLYWRSLPSRRHSLEILDNPRVAGTIVAQHSLQDSPHGIYFEGTASQVDQIDEIERIFPLFKQRLGRDRDIVDESQTPDGHKFYKVTVGTWHAFGSFDGGPPQKHTMVWHKTL